MSKRYFEGNTAQYLLLFTSVTLTLVIMLFLVSSPDVLSVAPPKPLVDTRAKVFPAPKIEYRYDDRKGFALIPSTRICYPPKQPENAFVCEQLFSVLKTYQPGLVVPYPYNSSIDKSYILLSVDTQKTWRTDQDYNLEISENEIKVTAPGLTGLFYAVQSLRLLLPADKSGFTDKKVPGLPALKVNDSPRWLWRGVKLNLVDQPLEIADLKHFLRSISAFKFNKLILKLGDDKFWGMPSAGFENKMNHEKKYSAEELREVVDYAKSLHVEVIPSLPLGTPPESVLVYYANYEKFVETQVKNCLKVFSGQHLFCDNISGSNYKSVSKICEQLNLKLVVANGNDIADGKLMRIINLDKGKVYQKAREKSCIFESEEFFDLASRQDDYSQDPVNPQKELTFEKLAAYKIPTEDLTATELKSIFGGNATLEGEGINNRTLLDYYAFPRLLALAQKLWDGLEIEPKVLAEDVQNTLPWLDLFDIAYRIEPPVVPVDKVFFYEVANFAIPRANKGKLNTFTIIERNGNRGVAAQYVKPVSVTDTSNLYVYNSDKSGRKSNLVAVYFEKQRLERKATRKGLFRVSARTDKDYCLPLSCFRVENAKVVDRIDYTSLPASRQIVNFYGFIQVPLAGKYTFKLKSDAPSRFFLSGNEIINHDFITDKLESEKSLNIQEGNYLFKLMSVFEPGQKAPELTWKLEEGTFKAVEEGSFSRIAKFEAIKVIDISSTIGEDRKNPLVYMLDGAIQGAYISTRAPKGDDEIVFIFRKKAFLDQIEIKSGQVNSLRKIEAAALDLSYGNQSYSESVSFVQGRVKVKPKGPIDSFRIRFTGASDTVVEINEVICK